MKTHRTMPVFVMRFAIIVFLIMSREAISANAAIQLPADEYPVFLPMVSNDHDTRWRWLEESTVTLAPAPHGNNPILLVIDQERQAHILWDTMSTPRFIYHSVQEENGWSDPVPIAQTLGSSETLFPPVMDSNGTIHLLWKNWLGIGGDKPYRLMYASYDDSNWSAEEEVWSSKDSYLQGMVHFDTQGNLRVTLLDSGTSLSTNIYQVVRGSGGWSEVHGIDPQQTYSWVWPDMQGGVHFYGDIYPDQMVYSYWRNDVFEVDGRQLAGQIGGNQTQLDGLNNLHMYRSAQIPVPGGTVYGISYQCLDSNLNWSDPEVVTGEASISGEIFKASDNTSRIALGWKELPEDALKLMVRQGCLSGGITRVPIDPAEDWELSAVTISHDPDIACALTREFFYSRYTLRCAELDGF